MGFSFFIRNKFLLIKHQDLQHFTFTLNPVKKCIWCGVLLISMQRLDAQHFYGIRGSSYGGSLNMLHNPAAIVNTPFPWDITLLGYQQLQSTNAVYLLNGSLLGWPDTLHYRYTDGHFKRYALVQGDLDLLQVRMALDRKRVIGFGVSAHAYGWAYTSPVTVEDTVNSLRSFLNIQQERDFNGRLTSSGWIDIHATYAQTWIDNPVMRLNGGLTLKIMRGISGAFARIDELQVRQRTLSQGNVYQFPLFSAKYGYSSNYDQQVASNTYDFLNHSQGSIAADLGVEYLIKKQEPVNYYAPDSYYDYWWKIGISLLDIGHNRFRYGQQSRELYQVQNNVTDATVEQKLTGIRSLQQFNDSVQRLVVQMNSLNGMFSISNPTRLVIDVDHPMQGQFSFNASVTVPIAVFTHGATGMLKSNEWLMFTPRWEKKRLGIYLPLQYTVEQRFWIGLALRAGPLLAGIHHLPGLFSSRQVTQSGGYIAITIRPDRLTPAHRDKRLNCPGF